jgi:hypothetical protein
METGTYTVRREGIYWLVRAGSVVVHRAPSKPEALSWAMSRSNSIYVQNFAGRLARHVG